MRRLVAVFAVVVVAVVVTAAVTTAVDQQATDDANRSLKSVRSQLSKARAVLNSHEEKVRLAKAGTDLAAQQAAQAEKVKADAAAQVLANQRAADQQAAEQAALRDHITADGVYLMGTDKNAGRWKTATAPDSCYWSITTDPNGANIVQNNFGAGVAYVDVPAGQFLKVQSCGMWDRIG